MTWITEAEFAEVSRVDPYYHGRWGYISAAIALARAALYGIQEPRVVEIGPGSHQLFRGSTILDVKGAPHFPPHDIGIAPWPVESADLVMGLQVWEHLGPHDPGEKQQGAFREALRRGSNVLLSFPLNWNCPEDHTHHGITRETIRCWTLGFVPTAEVVVSRRLICLWRL